MTRMAELPRSLSVLPVRIRHLVIVLSDKLDAQ